jgi:hypothetical protein
MKNQRVQKGSFGAVYSPTNPIVTRQAMEFFQSNDGFLAVKDVPFIQRPGAGGRLAVVLAEYLNRDEVAGPHLGAGRGREGDDRRRYGRVLDRLARARVRPHGRGRREDRLRVRHGRARVIARARDSRATSTSRAGSPRSGRRVAGTARSPAPRRLRLGRHDGDEPRLLVDTTKDPVPGIFAEKRLFLLRTGKMPTNLRLGFKAFEKLATNPFVRQQILGGSGRRGHDAADRDRGAALDAARHEGERVVRHQEHVEGRRHRRTTRSSSTSSTR